MSPVTHFLASWLVASVPKLERRDVALVTFAGVAPDVDGLGAIPELLTRHTAHPLDWFSRYHHVFAHNLTFAALVAIAVFALSGRRWLTAGLAFLTVHLHFAMDLLGSRGPDGYNWPIPYFEPFSSRLQLAWSGQWTLNSWQNVVLTCVLLCFTIARAIQTGRSPVAIFSERADRKVVQALKSRWERAPNGAPSASKVEKASDALWQLLLGVLDKAALALGDNRRVDFSRCIIVMTSNLGAAEMCNLAEHRFGFSSNNQVHDDSFDQKIERTAVEAARRKFTPEFMNRIDKVVVFRSLRPTHLRQILQLELGMVQKRILDAPGSGKFLFSCTERVKEFLLEKVLIEGTELVT